MNPKALYGGTLSIPPALAPCYVLSNRMRVTTLPGVADMLLLSDGPVERAMTHIKALEHTSRYAEVMGFRLSIQTFLADGETLHGLECGMVVHVLMAILSGGNNGPLGHPRIVERADELLRMLSRQGLVNLIDTACDAWHLRSPTELQDLMRASM